MDIITNYLAENAPYLDEASRSIIETVTADQFAVLVAASDAQSNGCENPGIDNALVRSHETLEDFDHSRANHWRERGYRDELNIGVQALRFEDVQMIKGQPRVTFVVVDFGDFRVVVK